VYEELKQNNLIHQNPKVLKTYPNLLLRSDETKIFPNITLLAPLRPAVCSHMAGTEIDPLITSTKLYMKITEDYNNGYFVNYLRHYGVLLHYCNRFHTVYGR